MKLPPDGPWLRLAPAAAPGGAAAAGAGGTGSGRGTRAESFAGEPRRSARPARRASARLGSPSDPGGLLAVRLPAWRSRLLLFLVFCAFAALAARAFFLQGGIATPFLKKEAAVRFERTLDIPATRGRITDRNGALLASSVPVRVVWAIPEHVDASTDQLRRLATLLQLPPADLTRRLDDEDRKFVILRHHVDPDTMRQIDALKIAGLHSSAESQRYYPAGPVAAHLVGITGGEERGEEGVELSFDEQLSGSAGMRRVIADNLQRIVEEDWLRPPVDGHDLTLSIDNRIQYAAFSALQLAVQANQARAGSIVVLDVRSGEILALANWPSYDPNLRGRLDADRMRDRAVTDTFEPGSTMKPISIAAAIEAGRVTPQTTIQTGAGRLVIGNRTITDTHALGLATVEQIIAKSSNVGAARIALDMPAQALWDMYARVGLGQAPQAGFPRAAPGRLWPARTWGQIQQATMAFGYGLSVSLLQLTRAYLAFARDGDLPAVTLLRTDQAPAAVRVLQPATALAMRRILEHVVGPEGTAPLARVDGYRVAGKTGTARKARSDGSGYGNGYIASFVGFAPVSEPRIAVGVMIDEPGLGHIYGGDVAAPVFSQVAGAALRTLQVAPDAPALPAPATLASAAARGVAGAGTTAVGRSLLPLAGEGQDEGVGAGARGWLR